MGDFYYDGGNILGKLDIDGRKPGLYIVCGNRTSGKTTFFNCWAWKKHEGGEFRKIGYIVRHKYELKTCSEQFFEPLANKGIFVPYEKGRVDDMGFCEMKVEGEVIGYGIALSAADKIKKVSNLFNDIDVIIWDEFQSITHDYIQNEIYKLREIIKSVCRGDGEFSRYVPMICISNAVSLLCPLLSSTDIPEKVRSDTKFLRGKGYVFEQNMNEIAAREVGRNPIICALGGEEENKELKYTSDNYSMVIKRPKGRGKYLMNIMDEGGIYSIERFDGMAKKGKDMYFCSERADKTFGEKYTGIDNLRSLNWVAPPNVGMLRIFYDDGRVFFSSLRARAAFVNFVKY